MRESEFREWLKRRAYQGRALTTKGINNRVAKAPRIERALHELGFEQRDLDDLHRAGLWPQLVKSVSAVASDWHSNEAAARKMAPQASDPTRQLTNLINVARQYGHFAAGRDPNYDAESDELDSDEIDDAALDALKSRFLDKFPSFETEGGFLGHSAYHLEEDDYKRALIAKVQSALTKRGSDELAQLGGDILDALEAKDHNLLGFYRTGARLKAVRQANPGVLESAAGKLARSNLSPPDAVAQFLETMWPLWRQGTEDNLPYAEARILPTVIIALARPADAISVIYQRYHNLGLALLRRSLFGNNVLTTSEYQTILDVAATIFGTMRDEWGWQPRDLWDVQGFIWVTCEEKLDMDDTSDADRIRRYAMETYFEPARERGESSVSIRAGDVHNALGLTNAHANVCQSLRGAKMQQLAQVGVPTFIGPDNSSTTTFTFRLSELPTAQRSEKSSPLNLILYGPPGTGKTYSTAREAVRLCDGTADYADTAEGRAALMARYRELEKLKRIAFITFHQNFDYESFVEGLRPETGGDAAESGGFRLEPRAGIFREICALADLARTRPSLEEGAAKTDLTNRRFWKMGQGAIGSEDDVYEDALANNFIALGWGGAIDWSEDRFLSLEAIRSEWLEKNPDDPTPSNWTQTYPFRVEMKPGDIVIVPYGNKEFRAVAQVVGDYEFEPAAEGYYAHRRKVRWLLVLDDPLPLDTIIDGNFTMRTLYRIASKRVNLPALSSLLSNDAPDGDENSKEGPTDQFVLIIDEINRANISKVFGELITLLEPDKRLGMSNALTVTLPYSKKKDFGVPANLHVIGTMNTADRSIASLDTALRRRFVFRELAPDTKVEAFQTAVRETGLPLDKVLDTINDRIEYLIDREHRIGHAFFIGCERREQVDAVMRDKVIPLLQEYFFEDWGRVAAVLGEQGKREGAFLDCRKLQDPTAEMGPPRESWSVRANFAQDAYEQLLGKGPGVAPEEALQ